MSTWLLFETDLMINTNMSYYNKYKLFDIFYQIWLNSKVNQGLT